MSEGIPIEVVSQEEAEKADFVVCLRAGNPTRFTDNATANCCDCGHEIFFRPYMPKGPPKICLECMKDRAEGGNA